MTTLLCSDGTRIDLILPVNFVAFFMMRIHTCSCVWSWIGWAHSPQDPGEDEEDEEGGVGIANNVDAVAVIWGADDEADEGAVADDACEGGSGTD